MLSRYFFSFIISFIIGVALEQVFGLGVSFSVLCAVLSFIVLFVSGTSARQKNVLLVSFVFAGLAVGAFRIDFFQMKQNAHSLDLYVGHAVEIQGIILSEPDVRDMYTNIVLEVRDVLYHGTHDVLENPTSILVRVPSYPEFQYGDVVTMVGKVTLPKNIPPKNGLAPFDYRAYLAKDEIFYQMYFPKVSVVAKHQGNFVREKLFALKVLLSKNIAERIPEPEASLGAGILLGAKQSLGDTLLQKFRETGVAHIVVLSGYNIAVVAGIISRMSTFMPFAVRLGASAFGIVLFAMMVGGGATVVRATVMDFVCSSLREDLWFL
jgi:competence protein ComEC